MKKYSRLKFYKTIRLDEELKLSDLMKSASMSAFTRKFNKETNKLMGNPTNHSKLVKMRVNRKKDYVTFFWLTERTPKYDDNFNTMVSNPKKNFALQKDNLYTIEIRFLNFFKLLGTKPKEQGDITNKDIEEVIQNCDLQVWDDTPSYEFQGCNYNMTMFNAAIYPEERPPNYWNKFHNENQFLSKHSAGIVNSIKFYIPQMRMIIKKYLGLTKK